MRSKVAKKLRSLFEQRFREAFPQFHRDKGAEGLGSRVFCWKICEEVVAYVMLWPHTNRDEFTVEAAWSRKSRFPNHLLCMHPNAIPECEIRPDEPKDGEYRVRIGSLIPPYRYDLWWRVSPGPEVGELSWEEMMDYVVHGDKRPIDPNLIAEKVNDAMRRIQDHVVPWLQEACIRLPA